MKHEITITQPEMTAKCSEALHLVFEDEPGLSEAFMKALLLSVVIVAKCFEEEEHKNEESISVNN